MKMNSAQIFEKLFGTSIVICFLYSEFDQPFCMDNVYTFQFMHGIVNSDYLRRIIISCNLYTFKPLFEGKLHISKCFFNSACIYGCVLSSVQVTAVEGVY